MIAMVGLEKFKNNQFDELDLQAIQECLWI